MSFNEAIALVRLLAQLEAKPQGERYKATLTAFNEAMRNYPITMFAAMVEYAMNRR